MNHETLPAQGPVDVNVRGWQPIETAPTDGTYVLLFEKYGTLPFIGRCMEPSGVWSASHEHVRAEGGWDGAVVVDYLCQELVLYWMPLPEAPNVEVRRGPTTEGEAK